MLFGLDLGHLTSAEEASENAAGIPSSPRTTSRQELDTAVHDFLSAWLLEAQPRFAVPYFSRSSYPCLEAMSENRGQPLPAGVVRYEILNSMAKYAEATGPVKNLDEAVGPVKLWDAAFRPFKNRYEPEFTLFGMPSDVAHRNECSEGPPPDATTKTKQKYGEYFGSAFRLHKGKVNEGTLYLVWARQYKKWQIVNVEYIERDDPGLSASANVDLPEEKVELRRVTGDPQANQNIHDFFKAWLLLGDFQTAVSFVSTVAYTCFDEPLAPAQGRQSLLSGLAEVRKALGRRTALADYLEPFIPEDPTFHLVPHQDEKAFAILSPPRSAAEGFLCAHHEKYDKTGEALPHDQAYGRYYVASFRVKVTDGEPAALYTLWSRETDIWKMVAWQLIAP